MDSSIPAIFLVGLLLAGLAVPAYSAKIIRDITFATVDASELKLDLYLPDTGKPAGLLVWVHGGAWKGGSRSGVDLKGLTEQPPFPRLPVLPNGSFRGLPQKANS